MTLVPLGDNPVPIHLLDPQNASPGDRRDLPGSVCQGGKRMAFFRKVSSG